MPNCKRNYKARERTEKTLCRITGSVPIQKAKYLCLTQLQTTIHSIVINPICHGGLHILFRWSERERQSVLPTPLIIRSIVSNSCTDKHVFLFVYTYLYQWQCVSIEWNATTFHSIQKYRKHLFQVRLFTEQFHFGYFIWSWIQSVEC
jgi:hypothetical protein